MRGKATGDPESDWVYRITPAYAGKRMLYYDGSLLGQDHPRLCGEKSAEKMSAFTDLGSPPPMRGKAIPYSTAQKWSRITPAYAGKSVPE